MSETEKRQAVCSAVVRALREARQRRGLSMAVLARQAGLSQAMISFVERELRNPTLDTLLRIAGVLEIDLGRVLQKAAREASRPHRR